MTEGKPQETLSWAYLPLGSLVAVFLSPWVTESGNLLLEEGKGPVTALGAQSSL